MSFSFRLPPRVRAVDFFAGAGGWGEAARRIELDVAVAANHWSIAVDTHRQNHKRTRHVCQNVDLIDLTSLPPFDVLIASPSCVPGDQPVVLADGREVRADALRIGDEVLTHQGRGRRVVNVWRKSYAGPIYSFLMWGDTKAPCRMTGDHRVWVRRRGGHKARLGEPFFVRADEVRVGDYVAFPRVAGEHGVASAFVSSRTPTRIGYAAGAHVVPAFRRNGRTQGPQRKPARVSSLPGAKVLFDPNAGPDLWWLLGQYVGDGQARTDRPEIGWSVGGSQENLARIRSILKRFGLHFWEDGPATNRRILTSSKHLRALCESFGRLAPDKYVPHDLLRLDAERTQAMIEGYLDADGCVSVSRLKAVDAWKATSTSLSLLQGIQRLCWRLGWAAGVSVADHAREGVIEGRKVQCRDTWELSVTKAPSKHARTKITEGHVWRSVRRITAESGGAVDVFDFEVEEDHTFCLPGMVVHNCQGNSRARGKERPHHDAERASAWVVPQVLVTRRPRWVVVENVVEMRETFEHYRMWLGTFAASGYETSEVVLNARDFGVPQDRERLFIVAALGGPAPRVVSPALAPLAFGPYIDWEGGTWNPVSDKVEATQRRVARAVADGLGDRFLVPYYGSGSGLTGRSVHRPVGTMTALARWAAVKRDRRGRRVMRMLSVPEIRRAMGFPDDYILPANKRNATRLLGNAVVPQVAAEVLAQTLGAPPGWALRRGWGAAQDVAVGGAFA